MNRLITISKITDPEFKAKIVEEILLDLPDWFGLPESTKKYIEDSKALPLWLASVGEERVGFATLSQSSEDCAELHCMGVKMKYHHQGIGTLLYKDLEQYAKKSFDYIQVKTVEEGRYKEYDLTVTFYKRMGFVKLEVFPTLWDKNNPCLIMIKKC